MSFNKVIGVRWILWGLLMLQACGRAWGAGFYRAGDIVEDFALTRRDTRERVRLGDFEGRIVVLEWFAWWCPFCQAAAPQVAEGIVEWYGTRNGNPAGVPVVHVAVNLQPNQEGQTQNFVTRAGFDLVLEDFDRALANRFQQGGQPIFAIINMVPGSPSHARGELLLHQDGYGQRDFRESLVRFRAVIDSVQAAPRVVTPPRIVDLRRTPEGRWRLGFESGSGLVVVESATAWGEWREVARVEATGAAGAVEVEDQGEMRRFFRLRAQ